MTHFAAMLDLETLGTRNNCVIVSFSCKIADLDDRRGFTIEAAFDKDLDILNQGERVIEASTVLWWMQQSDEARKQFINAKRIPFWYCMRDFWTWYKIEAPKIIHAPVSTIWSKGSNFDINIIVEAYKGSSQDAPWGYRDERCYRTIAALFPQITELPSEARHTASTDAISQLECLWRIWGILYHGSKM